MRLLATSCTASRSQGANRIFLVPPLRPRPRRRHRKTGITDVLDSAHGRLLQAAAYIQPFDVPGGETFLAVQPTSHSVSETVDTLSSTLEGDCDQDCVQWDGTQEECFDASAPWEAHEPSLTPLTGCDVHGEKRLQEGDEQAQCPLRLGLLLMLMLVGTVCMLIESVAVVEFLRPDTCSVDVSSLLHAASTFFTLSPEAFLPPT